MKNQTKKLAVDDKIENLKTANERGIVKRLKDYAGIGMKPYMDRRYAGYNRVLPRWMYTEQEITQNSFIGFGIGVLPSVLVGAFYLDPSWQSAEPQTYATILTVATMISSTLLGGLYGLVKGLTEDKEDCLESQ